MKSIEDSNTEQMRWVQGSNETSNEMRANEWGQHGKTAKPTI